MAFNIRIDEKQMQELRRQHAEQVQAVTDLSNNLAKWLALVVQAMNGDSDNDTQVQIDEHAAQVRAVREKLQTSIDNQPKGD